MSGKHCKHLKMLSTSNVDSDEVVIRVNCSNEEFLRKMGLEFNKRFGYYIIIDNPMVCDICPHRED